MFGSVIWSVLAFLLALGILISIHEFGHFWVARKVGVKVLRYSIGFGKPLVQKTGKVDNTEFVLAAIPLGGYVKMLDEREAPVARHEQHRAFNRQPLWARAAVVIAGPLANFLLAIVAYWIVMMIGISGIAPLLGQVPEGSPAAAAGFQYEDRIRQVDGRTTPTWSDARIALLDASLDATAPVPIEVQTASGEVVTRNLAVDSAAMLQTDSDSIADLGFELWWPQVEPIIGDVQAEGPAAAAGMLAGDRILAVDGVAMDSWRDVVNAVQPSPGKTLVFEVERSTGIQELSITPDVITIDDAQIGRIGVIETQSAELVAKSRVKVSHPPLQAIGLALQRTYDMSLLTVRMLGKLVVGEASLDNISGPISIAQFAGQSASVGIDHYINFIALISISLAVLNLLPIPMLDGGHLLYFACEAVLRRPVPEQVQIWGQQLGIVLLGGLMFLAFYNDIWRLLG